MNRHLLRQKAIVVNMMNYFVMHARSNISESQMFKKLYTADVKHFRETGRTITDVDYQAWGIGPVMVQSAEYFETIGRDMADVVQLKSKTVYVFKLYLDKNPDMTFDPSIFTPRQMHILADVVKADWISKYNDNGSYEKVWNNGAGFAQRIPFEATIPDNDPHRNDILSIYQEHTARLSALKQLNRLATTI